MRSLLAGPSKEFLWQPRVGIAFLSLNGGWRWQRAFKTRLGGFRGLWRSFISSGAMTVRRAARTKVAFKASGVSTSSGAELSGGAAV